MLFFNNLIKKDFTEFESTNKYEGCHPFTAFAPCTLRHAS